uniref:Uncharacterized protein n=1 Tax=Glossina austeni TaxID=7395 RepID=A0A1A9UW19_GLOAU
MNNSAFLSNDHYTAYQIIPIDNFHAQNTLLALVHMYRRNYMRRVMENFAENWYLLQGRASVSAWNKNSIVDYAGNASLDNLMCEALVNLYPLEACHHISSQDNDDNDEANIMFPQEAEKLIKRHFTLHTAHASTNSNNAFEKQSIAVHTSSLYKGQILYTPIFKA